MICRFIVSLLDFMLLFYYNGRKESVVVTTYEVQKWKLQTARCALFRGLTETEAGGYRGPADAPPPFAKGEVLLRPLSHRAAIGCGTGGPRAYGASDVWGSKTLLGHAGPGDLFAET